MVGLLCVEFTRGEKKVDSVSNRDVFWKSASFWRSVSRSSVCGVGRFRVCGARDCGGVGGWCVRGVSGWFLVERVGCRGGWVVVLLRESSCCGVVFTRACGRGVFECACAVRGRVRVPVGVKTVQFDFFVGVLMVDIRGIVDV